MYSSQKYFAKYIEIYQYEQQNVVLIFIGFGFINFGFQLRYMYRKNGLFLRGHVLEPN